MIGLSIVIICLIANALLAAFEMAFVSFSRAKLLSLGRAGNRRALRVLRLRDNPERTLSIIQIGINLVGAVSAAVGGAGAIESLAPYLQSRFGASEGVAEFWSIALVVIPLTCLNVLVGELVPKTLALRDPIGIVLFGSRWILWADKAFAPLVTFFELSTRMLVRIFFPRSRSPEARTDLTVELDSLSEHHQRAVLNLAHIERRRLRDIALPWSEVVFLRDADTLEEVLPVVFSSGHTRLPVLEGDRVRGVLHTKEFLALREAGAREWQSIIRPVLVVSSDGSAISALRLMQAQRTLMAVVVSPSGERIGLVTMEDILEEVWGDFFDEDDDGRLRRVLAERSNARAGRATRPLRS